MTALTDTGNGIRLVRRHGRDLRYCHPFGRWYVWDQTRWAPDDTGGVARAAKDTADAIWDEAKDEQDEEKRKLIRRWAARSEGAAGLKNMMWCAQSEADVVVRPAELDFDPWALNVENGTLDLRSGRLLAHDRADLITKVCPVEYHPDAEAPIWDAFLKRIMGGDDDLISFLQRAIGYSLTGVTDEECMFIPYGTGANGKSKFLGAIRSMVGGYGQKLPRETLMAKSYGGGIPNDIAAMQGIRFAPAIETGERRRLDEEQVKELTGGDTVSARFLHAEFFEFKPVAKIWLATNHKPKVDGTDEGIWRRIRLVPFQITIPEDERDPDLGRKLDQELPGILGWAVKGCLAWQQEGLTPPETITSATQAYRAEEDDLADFLDAECILATSKWATSKAIHARFEDYTGEKISKKELGHLLNQRGFVPCVKQQQRAWQGLGLIDRSGHDATTLDEVERWAS